MYKTFNPKGIPHVRLQIRYGFLADTGLLKCALIVDSLQEDPLDKPDEPGPEGEAEKQQKSSAADFREDWQKALRAEQERMKRMVRRVVGIEVGDHFRSILPQACSISKFHMY